MYDYQLEIHEEAAGVWLSCPDVPEMHAAGATLEEAYAGAHDAMETALSLYVDRGARIPSPRPERIAADRRGLLRQRALTTAKIVLWNAMQDQGVSKRQLAIRLGVARPQVDRLVDFVHASRLDGIEQALLELGLRLSLVSVEAA